MWIPVVLPPLGIPNKYPQHDSMKKYGVLVARLTCQYVLAQFCIVDKVHHNLFIIRFVITQFPVHLGLKMDPKNV